MLVHSLIIAVHIAVVAAFLILWYFWVKKKLGASLFLENEDQILFPFKYFSWLFIGLVLATSLVQIHFVRVSATVHERLTALSSISENQEAYARSLEGTREMIQKLRADIDINFKGVRSQVAELRSNMQSAVHQPSLETGQSAPLRKPALAGLPPSPDAEKDFAREARASHGPLQQSAATRPQAAPESETKSETFRMSLNRKGRVLTDNLRVHKRPGLQTGVVDKLMAGQEVKVTEKLMANDAMWFRVVTPSGRSGWVHFGHVKLGDST